MSIRITHNAGFFSCCYIRLLRIVEYIQAHRRLPDTVDSSRQFEWYKVKPRTLFQNTDITFDYFRHYHHTDPVILSYPTLADQFSDYLLLDYKNMCPLVEKYFTPSLEVKRMIQHLEDKYQLEYENLCVLFYRGNDKSTETTLCAYEEYVAYADKVIAERPRVRFLLQSDETEFLDFFTERYPSFYFKDEIRHVPRCNSTVDKICRTQIDVFSKYYLAITVIMSKCAYIVCGSGNCSLWIMLYRGHGRQVYQNLNGSWIQSEAEA